LTAEQLSELKKALSEPIPTDDGNYRDWQTKDAIQFVREHYNIEYSESRMRQIIEDLGLRRTISRPGSKKVK
jgi:transposase